MTSFAFKNFFVPYFYVIKYFFFDILIRLYIILPLGTLAQPPCRKKSSATPRGSQLHSSHSGKLNRSGAHWLHRFFIKVLRNQLICPQIQGEGRKKLENSLKPSHDIYHFMNDRTMDKMIMNQHKTFGGKIKVKEQRGEGWSRSGKPIADFQLGL